MHAAIEPTKAVILAFREVETMVHNARSIQKVQRVSGPALKQPSFNWKCQISTMSYIILK